MACLQAFNTQCNYSDLSFTDPKVSVITVLKLAKSFSEPGATGLMT